jgi:hypothetical protein
MAEFSSVNTSRDRGGFNAQGLPSHPEYQNYIRRWEFLIRSYLGGLEYRFGNYLTKYQMESSSEYISRLAQTPYDNHCKSVVHIFNSFLFRTEPNREFGSLENMPELDAFLKDADLEGRTWQSFIKDVNILSSVYGHVLVLVDKSDVNVGTRAEELAQGLRPYVSIYTPENIIDWQFTRLASGLYECSYVKLLEREMRYDNTNVQFYIRTITKDSITIESYQPNQKNPLKVIEVKPNNLGKVPVVWVYAQRSPTRGIGVSDIGDIADMANGIYNELSEIEATIRLSGHPSLVKTRETEASAGAGAIINMPNDLDPGLRPALLQPSGQSIDSILNSMKGKIEAIDRMAFLGSMRAIEQRSMSGVALQTEMLQLDVKLNEKARNLELAEEQIWRLFANWMNMVFDGEIKYPSQFQVRDRNFEMDLIKKAADSNPTDPRVKAAIDVKILDILEVDESDIATPAEQAEIQEQLMTGESNEEIIEDNPGTTVTDIEAAAAAAARDN